MAANLSQVRQFVGSSKLYLIATHDHSLTEPANGGVYSLWMLLLGEPFLGRFGGRGRLWGVRGGSTDIETKFANLAATRRSPSGVK